jgi:hypothetical protein
MGRCWLSRPAGSAWMRRSPSWPRPHLGRRSSPGWAACAGSGADQLRAGRGDRRLAPLHRGHDRGLAGLVPSEQPSGGRRSQGSITKTGNSHARRLLVEAAWHHRKPYRPSRELRARQDRQPAVVREPADRGNRRLHQRWCRLNARAKRSTISVVAVAGELAGWCWSLAVLEA